MAIKINMIRFVLNSIVSVAIILVVCTCKKLDKLTTFKMDYTQNITIPSSTGINLPFNVTTPDVTTNSENKFQSNNTRKDLIQEIYLTKTRLRITSPSNGTFSFLKSISIYLNANGLPETKIAWKDNILSNVGNEIELDVSGDDLKEYIKKDQFTLRVNTVTDEILATDYNIEAYTQFKVNAKVLGM